MEKNQLFAFDTETTGLNTRKASVLGYSVTAILGTGFYVPLLGYLKESD